MRPDPALAVLAGLTAPPARPHALRPATAAARADDDRNELEPAADVVGGEDRMEHLALVAATVAPPLRMRLVKREPAFPAVGPARRSAPSRHCDAEDACEPSGESGCGFGSESFVPGRDLV